jgi:PAS domain S-box-containing protein
MYHHALNVLLIDDDEDDYLIVRDLLADLPQTRISLDWTSSYAEGLAAIAHAAYDAYLVDYQLGAQTGLELIAQAHAAGCTAPLILLTGQDDRRIDLSALEAGATDYLVKGQISAPLLERSLRYAVEHTHTLAELRASRERYRLVAETATDAIISAGLDATIIFANHAAEEIFGYRPDELIGRQLDCIFCPTMDGSALQAVEQLLADTQHGTIRTPVERVGCHRSGRAVPLEISVGVAIEHGQPVLTCVIRDISERRRLEEELRQAQKMEAVGRLAGGVAHDFNNVLTAITGYGDLILNDIAQNQPLRREDIEQILQAARRAARLTQQLLAFSRKQVLQPEILNLNVVIAEMAPMLRKLIGEDVNLTVALASQPMSIEVDPGQIQQVIMNLAVNARDAMPRGGSLRLHTRSGVDERGTPQVILEVSDSGEGMDEETCRHIFEPFFTTKERGKGTGLGLSTVYGIVKQSGGDISVVSQVGGGTTFTITLPQVFAATPQSPGYRREGPTRGSETVLLVEDDHAVRNLLATTLEHLGYSVLTAADGAQALALAAAYPAYIHLLITDVVMPKVSGPELATRLRAVRPEIRVVFISGYTDDALSMHNIGAIGGLFLQKPFLPYELARKVRAAFDTPLPTALIEGGDTRAEG